MLIRAQKPFSRKMIDRKWRGKVITIRLICGHMRFNETFSLIYATVNVDRDLHYLLAVSRVKARGTGN